MEIKVSNYMYYYLLIKANYSPDHRNFFEDIFFESIVIRTVFELLMPHTIYKSFSSLSEVKID